MKLAVSIIAFLWAAVAGGQSKAENLIIITFDGFRWQEMFGGADSILIRDKKFVDDTAELIAQFWAPTPGERRKKLL